MVWVCEVGREEDLIDYMTPTSPPCARVLTKRMPPICLSFRSSPRASRRGLLDTTITWSVCSLLLRLRARARTLTHTHTHTHTHTPVRWGKEHCTYCFEVRLIKWGSPAIELHHHTLVPVQGDREREREREREGESEREYARERARERERSQGESKRERARARICVLLCVLRESARAYMCAVVLGAAVELEHNRCAQPRQPLRFIECLVKERAFELLRTLNSSDAASLAQQSGDIWQCQVFSLFRPARCTRGSGDRFGIPKPRESGSVIGADRTVWALLCVAERRATRPSGEWGYRTRRHMLEPSAQRRCHPTEALYVPTFSHLLIVNKLLSLSLSLSLSCMG